MFGYFAVHCFIKILHFLMALKMQKKIFPLLLRAIHTYKIMLAFSKSKKENEFSS